MRRKKMLRQTILTQRADNPRDTRAKDDVARIVSSPALDHSILRLVRPRNGSDADLIGIATDNSPVWGDVWPGVPRSARFGSTAEVG
jgi:hypothetical protein